MFKESLNIMLNVTVKNDVVTIVHHIEKFESDPGYGSVVKDEIIYTNLIFGFSKVFEKSMNCDDKIIVKIAEDAGVVDVGTARDKKQDYEKALQQITSNLNEKIHNNIQEEISLINVNINKELQEFNSKMAEELVKLLIIHS